MTTVMRVAYLVNQYPKVSHSFIRREILALERQGVEIMRIALRGWDGELVDAADELERKRTRYVLREGASALLLAGARVLATRPARLLQAWRWRGAWAAARSGRCPCTSIYLAEACRIVAVAARGRYRSTCTRISAPTPPRSRCWCTRWAGRRWSFTVHGPEEFDKAPSDRLAEKMRRCAFVVAISSYGRSQLYRLVEHEHWRKVQRGALRAGAAFRAVPASPLTGGTTPRLRRPALRAEGPAAAGRGCAAAA